jgi:hypothetical protein
LAASGRKTAGDHDPVDDDREPPLAPLLFTAVM